MEDLKQELTHVSNVSCEVNTLDYVVYCLSRLVKELESRMTKASERLQEELSANDKG